MRVTHSYCWIFILFRKANSGVGPPLLYQENSNRTGDWGSQELSRLIRRDQNCYFWMCLTNWSPITVERSVYIITLPYYHFSKLCSLACTKLYLVTKMCASHSGCMGMCPLVWGLAGKGARLCSRQWHSVGTWPGGETAIHYHTVGFDLVCSFRDTGHSQTVSGHNLKCKLMKECQAKLLQL